MIENVKNRLGALNREDGQTMVEYALILSLVSIAAVATLTPLGTAVATIFTTVTAAL